MTFYYFLISFYAIFLGAVWGRVDGGGIAKVNEWLERSLIMFYFVLACAPFAGLYALWAYAGVLGIATGHGQYFLNRAIKYLGDRADGSKGTYERVDPVVRLLFGRDPRTDTKYAGLDKDVQFIQIKKAMEEYGTTKLYWRNVFGMFCTGFFVGLPAAILAACFQQWVVVGLMLLTGPVKALAYVVGYQLFNNTESAEYINGGLRTALCVAAVLSNIIT